MKTSLTLATLVLSALIPLHAAAATSIKATVNGMVCAFCAQGIEKRLSKLDAAQTVFVDLKRKTVAVQIKDGQSLDEKTIAHEISEAGYDVVKLERVSQSVSDIKAQLKSAK